jgi:C4-dicarboxylate transporter DctM subunit
MDAVSAILICTPLFLPIVQSIGMDPVHFGFMLTVNLAIGFVTPPVGVNLFVASSMTGIPVTRLAKKCTMFLLFFLAALLIITFVPQVSLILLGQ